LPATVTLIRVAKAEHVFQNLTQEEAEKANTLAKVYII